MRGTLYHNELIVQEERWFIMLNKNTYLILNENMQFGILFCQFFSFFFLSLSELNIFEFTIWKAHIIQTIKCFIW